MKGKISIILLLLKLRINDLNGNEKYVYLEKTLSTNSSKVEVIENGDMLLFSDNCLVLFYKLFTTSYSYTKIGHIENLPEFSNNTIEISITE